MFNQTSERFTVALVFLIFIKIQTAKAAAPENDSSNCELHDGSNRFHWIDYTVVAIMLIVSCGIGTFYGFFGKEQKTSADFLLGGRGMGTLPMAMSLAAGFITAIELLGNPKEMYEYGTMFWLQCFAYILVIPIASYLYLPVFMKLHLTSSYEYLERRFNKYARIIAASMYAFQMILYTAVAVYAPALALSHVTGLHVYIAVTLVYLVCIFYASQGGMKAVIMADTFQAIVLVLSIIIILILGNNTVGGFSKVIESNLDSKRIEFFVLDFDPKTRHSLWSVIIGGTFYWATMFCSNQASIQKYLTVETLGQARRALWVSSISLVVILSINFYTGMIMYTEYKGCDPVRNKEICDSDQLLPLFVMKSLGSYRGVPGLFVAGIFAASLGTVACTLNSLAAVTMEDIFSSMCNIQVPENKGSIYSKWISVFYGLLSYFLVFVVERLGSLLQVALSFNGMAGGVTLGLFSLGMFFPWANSKGALSGAIIAGGFVLFICFGAQDAIANGYEPAPKKIVHVNECPNSTLIDYDITDLNNNSSSNSEIWPIFKISYLWYSGIGCVMTVFVGLIVSLITGPEDPCRLHPDLVSPPVQNLLKKLPNYIKELLHIPLESKTTSPTCKEKKTNVSEFGGIVNHAINMENDVTK